MSRRQDGREAWRVFSEAEALGLDHKQNQHGVGIIRCRQPDLPLSHRLGHPGVSELFFEMGEGFKQQAGGAELYHDCRLGDRRRQNVGIPPGQATPGG